MNKVLIIAEVGVNHNGELRLAKKMIRAAAKAGADVVKFQTFRTESLVTTKAPKAKYQKKRDNADESQFQMLKRLELPYSKLDILQKECERNRVLFLSTAFDLESLNVLHKMKLPFFKIPSGEITNYLYLKKIAQFGRPVILSTGMCTLDEIEKAVRLLEKNGIRRSFITLLHCNTEYPTPYRDVHLRAMQTLRSEFGVNVGYSDHTMGTEVAIAAVALGASVIEKHFTLDCSMSGPDHKASIEPLDFKRMVDAIRHIETALGRSTKKPSASEKKNIKIARKSIVASQDIKKGDFFSEKNITVKRPGTGISPMQWNRVIGRKAKKNFHLDDLISI